MCVRDEIYKNVCNNSSCVDKDPLPVCFIPLYEGRTMYSETSDFTKTGAVARMTCILCPRFPRYVKFIRRRDQRRMI